MTQIRIGGIGCGVVIQSVFQSGIQGDWDASVNLFPTIVNNSIVKKGYKWRISVPGTLAGIPVDVGAVIEAWTDNPGQSISNWRITY